MFDEDLIEWHTEQRGFAITITARYAMAQRIISCRQDIQWDGEVEWIAIAKSQMTLMLRREYEDILARNPPPQAGTQIGVYEWNIDPYHAIEFQDPNGVIKAPAPRARLKDGRWYWEYAGTEVYEDKKPDPEMEAYNEYDQTDE